MDNSQIQSSIIKSSSEEVVSKLSEILAAIDRCGCKHCVELLKSGLGTNSPPTQDVSGKSELVKSAVVTSHSNDDTIPTPEPTGVEYVLHRQATK